VTQPDPPKLDYQPAREREPLAFKLGRLWDQGLVYLLVLVISALVIGRFFPRFLDEILRLME
jgi:hypothetical protein